MAGWTAWVLLECCVIARIYLLLTAFG